MSRCPSGDRYCNRFRENGTESLCRDCEEDARLGAWCLGQVGLIVMLACAVEVSRHVSDDYYVGHARCVGKHQTHDPFDPLDVLRAALAPVKR